MRASINRARPALESLEGREVMVLNGRFTSVAADGATIFGTDFGTCTPQPDGRVRFEVTAVYQGGTGRLSGVTGRADAVAVVEADGALHFDTTGSLTF